MPVSTDSGVKVWRKRTTRAQLLMWFGWLLGLAITVVCLQKISDQTIWEFVADAPAQGADIIDRMLPPEWSYAGVLLRPLWDTLNMATLGTALAVVLSVPLALLAARNTTPSRSIARPIALFIIVSSRSINSLIWALLLVTILGPGVLAGVIAIALRSIGFIGKLLYEAMEESDIRPPEAITATGAGRAQVITYGIIPQVLPAFAGITVFRWDFNIRESTVLGLVGAGGIGLQLNAAISNLDWARVSTILAVLFATVAVSEFVSAKVRKAVT